MTPASRITVPSNQRMVFDLVAMLRGGISTVTRASDTRQERSSSLPNASYASTAYLLDKQKRATPTTLALEEARLELLDMIGDMPGILRGILSGVLPGCLVRRLFAYWQTNEKPSAILVAFKDRGRRAVFLHSRRILGTPVDRPSARVSSLRNSPVRRLR